MLPVALLAAVLILVFAAPRGGLYRPRGRIALAGSAFAVMAAIFLAILDAVHLAGRWAIRSIRGGLALARSRVTRFVILGLDGIDYRLTPKFLGEGKLPNLAALRSAAASNRWPRPSRRSRRSRGRRFRLGSIRASTTFSISSRLTGRRTIRNSVRSRSDRRGGPSVSASTGCRWEKARHPAAAQKHPLLALLGKHGIFAAVLRVPITFPPEKLRGVLLAGMCVPDLRGSQGMFPITARGATRMPSKSAAKPTRSVREDGAVAAALVGPITPSAQTDAAMKLPFVVKIQGPDAAELRIGREVHRLRKGVYSPWIRVAFRAAPGVKVQGVCRFLLRSTEPEFALYVTPINLDPERPAMPISYPAVYSTYLAKRQGPFATLGLAEDYLGAKRGRPRRRNVPRAVPRRRPRTRSDVLRLPRQGQTRAVRRACSTAPTASSTPSGATPTPGRRSLSLRERAG